MSKQFDVPVIGGGPGGYVARSRAAQLGCPPLAANPIPCRSRRASPAWAGPAERRLRSVQGPAALVRTVRGSASILCRPWHQRQGGVAIDVPTMVGRKNTIVNQLTGGNCGLFKKNKVTALNGHGSFVGKEGELLQGQGRCGRSAGQARHRRHWVQAASSARYPVDNKVIW